MQSIYRTLLAQLGEPAGTVLTFGGKAPVSVTPTPKNTVRPALEHYNQLLRQYRQRTADLYRQKLCTAAVNAVSNQRDALLAPDNASASNIDHQLQVLNSLSNQRDALPAVPVKTVKTTSSASKTSKPKPANGGSAERW